MTKSEKRKEYKKEWRKKNEKKIKEYNKLNREKKKEYDKEYNKLNREKKKEQTKQYRERNKEKQKEYMKEWIIKNKENVKENRKQYYKQNLEKIVDYKKQYYKQNLEKIVDYKKQYQKQNSEKIKEYKKQYYNQNKKTIVEKTKEYNKQRRKTDPVFRTTLTLRNTVNHFFQSISKKKNDRTHNLVGCSTKKFIEFVGEKPVGDYHLDHIIPISLFNITDPKYFKVVCNYCNFQWLTAEDNLKKSNTLSQEDYNKFVENCMRENQHEILELFFEMNIQPINIGVKKI